MEQYQPQKNLDKFASVWEQTEATVRLVVSYFHWIWVHSRQGNTVAERSGLALPKALAPRDRSLELG